MKRILATALALCIALLSPSVALGQYGQGHPMTHSKHGDKLRGAPRSHYTGSHNHFQTGTRPSTVVPYRWRDAQHRNGQTRGQLRDGYSAYNRDWRAVAGVMSFAPRSEGLSGPHPPESTTTVRDSLAALLCAPAVGPHIFQSPVLVGREPKP